MESDTSKNQGVSTTSDGAPDSAPQDVDARPAADQAQPVTEQPQPAVDQTQPAATAAAAATGSGGGGAVWVALALAIAACAGSGYLWYRFDVQQRHAQEITAANLSGELKGVTETARALEKRQDELAADQSKLGALIQEKLEDNVAKLQQQQQELSASVSKIYESMDRSIDSWALEEVEQLLRMANHSVALAGDTEIALTALQLADNRLEQLGNPDFLEIRRLIAGEITQLKAVNQVDLPGLAFRLASLAAAVDELPLQVEPDRSVAAAGGAATSDQSNPWLKAGHELLSDLKSLVRIQNVTEPAKPLLTPEQRYYLVANLRLMLSGAQIAVLRADTQTFRTNLQQASQWLGEYFDVNAAAVQSMITEINQMDEQDLTPERPNIAGSIAELQRVKSRMKSQ